MDSNIVSCSTIRNFISLGDFNSANKLLGYKFFIQGSVIKCEKLASRIGFPSANINYPEEKIKMPSGVYFVIVTVDGVDYNGILYFGASLHVVCNKVWVEGNRCVEVSKEYY